MKNGNKKISIIVTSIIIILAIIGGIFAYLFIATDTFKDNKELFGKYISQNAEIFHEFTKSSIYDTYQSKKNESIYEAETSIKFSNSEGGEISNPINDLCIKTTEKRNNTNEYVYADAQVLFKDDQYLKAEVIKETNIYGIRFSNVVKQFVSVKDGGNISEVATDLGTEVEDLVKIFEILDGTKNINEEILSKDDITELKNKYFGIITDNVANGTFSKIKKSMITINNNTVQTNAYIVNLSSEQVQNIITEILNTIKADPIILEKITNIIDEDTFIEQIDTIIEEISEDAEIPSAKITVYEQKGTTIRTAIEIGMYKIVIDNSQQNGQINSKIQITELDSEESNEINIEIDKQIGEEQEVCNILIDFVSGEETIEISLNNEIQSDNIKTTISYTKDIETTSIIIENTINVVDSISEKIELDKTNNVVLNDLDSEKRKNIINLLKTKVPEKTTKRIELLKKELEITTEPNQGNETGQTEMNQTDVNKFNAKFEFYTGDEVSAENVRILLDIVKTNINSVEITPIENTENTNQNETKENIRLNIEKDKENVELINSIVEKIEDKKKYKVTISYNNTNGLIDYINISEIDKK